MTCNNMPAFRPPTPAELSAVDSVLAPVYAGCRSGSFMPKAEAMPPALLQWMADGAGVTLRSAKRQMAGIFKAMHGPGMREDYRYDLDQAIAAHFPGGRLCLFIPSFVYTRRFGWNGGWSRDGSCLLCAVQEDGRWRVFDWDYYYSLQYVYPDLYAGDDQNWPAAAWGYDAEQTPVFR